MLHTRKKCHSSLNMPTFAIRSCLLALKKWGDTYQRFDGSDFQIVDWTKCQGLRQQYGGQISKHIPTCGRLRTYDMCLNPKKYTFRVGGDKFLSFMYHCTPQTTTNETNYRLTYDIDIVIPMELGEQSARTLHFY